ncbi:MAG: hypothetical protein CVV58_05880, partial [Tenericutes bacterium HGW-Tenericutes-3]
MKKFTLLFKKGLEKVISSFKDIGAKKLILMFLAFVLLLTITLSFFKKSSIDTYFDTSTLSYNYTNESLSTAFNTPLYTYVKQTYDNRNLIESDIEQTILTGDMISTNRINESDIEYGQIVSDYIDQTNLTQDVFLLDDTHSVSFINTSSVSGLYYFALDYYELEESISNTQISIKINGETPFYESQTLVLPSRWELTTTEFTLDRYYNEIQPSSDKIKNWTHHKINDYRGMHPGLFAFELEENDVIEIEYVNGQLLIGQFYYVLEDDIPTYDAYLATHGNAEVINDDITIAARDMEWRNDASIRLRSEYDPSNLYYDTQFLRLNVIFGDSWQNSGQDVTYRVDVETSGYYYLTFKYRQYMIKDMPVFRKIKVDGEVPFEQLESYPFPYTVSFLNRTLTDENGENLKIYLEAGSHELTLEAVNYPYRQTIETIQYVMNEIQSLALNIKRYTSGGTDRYRDWDIETYFPTASADILDWANLLNATYQELLAITDNDQPSEIGNLNVAATRLTNIANDINKLPSLMVQFSDGDSSVNQMLGNMMQRLMRSNLELERTIFHGENAIAKPYANVFVRFWEGTKRLVLSFINNPYSASSRKD